MLIKFVISPERTYIRSDIVVWFGWYHDNVQPAVFCLGQRDCIANTHVIFSRWWILMWCIYLLFVNTKSMCITSLDRIHMPIGIHPDYKLVCWEDIAHNIRFSDTQNPKFIIIIRTRTTCFFFSPKCNLVLNESKLLLRNFLWEWMEKYWRVLFHLFWHIRIKSLNQLPSLHSYMNDSDD